MTLFTDAYSSTAEVRLSLGQAWRAPQGLIPGAVGAMDGPGGSLHGFYQLNRGL